MRAPVGPSIQGYGFDVTAQPVVTAGAYSAGDIVGGLMTFEVAEYPDSPVIITGIEVAIKVAVTSSLKLVLFAAKPFNTSTGDNAAYSLSALDVFKVITVVDLSASTVLATDHGTPNTYSAHNLNIVCRPERDKRCVHALLIDGTGWTLTGTADIQVRLRGLGA